jgi:hypothetical protein
MRTDTLFRVFRPVNSVNPNSFHVVSSSRRASDEAGFVAPTFPESCVEGHNNFLPGGVNEKTKEDTYEVVGDYREKENGHQLGTSGRVEDKSTTCGRATGQRGRLHSLVVQFFLNWHRDAESIGTEGRHSFSSPRSGSTVRPPQNPPPMIAAASQSFTLSPATREPRKAGAPPALEHGLISCATRTYAPVSPLMDEHLARLTCNLACVRFGAIWDISGKRFVLFGDPITGTSLALSLDIFCVQAVRSHVRASREKFGIVEDL